MVDTLFPTVSLSPDKSTSNKWGIRIYTPFTLYGYVQTSAIFLPKFETTYRDQSREVL